MFELEIIWASSLSSHDGSCRSGGAKAASALQGFEDSDGKVKKTKQFQNHFKNIKLNHGS